MTASITWLDQSVEQQRRVRELVNLFSQRDSRDELGLGQVRDVFSEALFPGISVIQTRARYFLFVPWLFRQRARRASGTKLLTRVHDDERRLIETLRAEGAERGLIGVQAGVKVKILPSTIYWYGLGRWQILAHDLAPDQLGGPGASTEDVSDELTTRHHGDWHPTLPPPPGGFPDVVPGGFLLRHEEASWLTEQIVRSVPESLVAHLVTGPAPPDAESLAPWDDPVATAAPHPVAGWLHHARLFSLSMYGAALLYNLLVAEAYERSGMSRIQAPVEEYRTQLAAWHDEVERHRPDLLAWDRADLRAEVAARNPRIAPRTWRFLDDWFDLVISRAVPEVANSSAARNLVANRERAQKGRQSRLANEKLLAVWSGASGARPLTYRWATARDIVTDIFEGREAGRAGA